MRGLHRTFLEGTFGARVYVLKVFLEKVYKGVLWLQRDGWAFVRVQGLHPYFRQAPLAYPAAVGCCSARLSPQGCFSSPIQLLLGKM